MIVPLTERAKANDPGGPRATLTSSDQTSNPGAIVTYVVGALNLDSTFAGTNTNTGKAQLLALTKVGSGR